MKTIIIAPHPDDEILGAGGTLLRRKAEGGTLAWVVATSITEDAGWSAEQVDRRTEEMRKVAALVGFDEVHQLNFPTTRLDVIPMGNLISAISKVFHSFQPNEVFLPHYSDVHTDHRVLALAVSSCTKWFRYPSITRVLAYETLSETEFGLGGEGFRPNVFVDIGSYLETKVEAMSFYANELSAFPFPRSYEAMRALAAFRGAQSGFTAAESFELLRERG